MKEVLLLSLAFSASFAESLIIHVAPTGSDANPGTRDEPLHSLQAAQERIRPYAGERPVDEQFFRGWIDEAFIFDTALNQNQIKHLMRTNQWAGASTGD